MHTETGFSMNANSNGLLGATWNALLYRVLEVLSQLSKPKGLGWIPDVCHGNGRRQWVAT